MRRLFISYRRDDSLSETGRIRDYLRAHLGEDRIFRDLDDIGAGAVFPKEIEKALKQCDAVLVIIGPGWLTIEDEKSGHRRLDNPADWVRVEVATALRLAEKRRILIVPVLIDETPMPASDMLPEDIRGLAHRNASQVRSDKDFDHDMERLLLDIGGKLKQENTRRWGCTYALIATVLAVIALLYIYFDWQSDRGVTPIITTPVSNNSGPEPEANDPTPLPPTPTQLSPEPAVKEGAVLPPANPKESNEIPLATPSGAFTNIWQVPNIFDEFGMPGMVIHSSFVLENAQLANCIAVAYFEFQDGTKLWDGNYVYRAADGQVAASLEFVPIIDPAVYNDFALYIPYHELELANGIHFLQAYQELYCDNQFLASSPYVPFDVTVQY